MGSVPLLLCKLAFAGGRLALPVPDAGLGLR